MQIELVMKPPLFVEKRIADLESEIMYAKTAPHYAQTMRPGDMAYEMTERMLERIKKEKYYDSIR